MVNVAIRGALTEPQVDGRLELRNASLFLRDFPNGVDQANGLILFDRNRATVQDLDAPLPAAATYHFESGSFVGFRGEALLYTLQATAHNVAIVPGRTQRDGRWPTWPGRHVREQRPVRFRLAGSRRVQSAHRRGRAACVHRQAGRRSATPNEYLRGLQFDVHIVTTRTLEVETSLTRNIQADADLRLRGTPDQPVLLGHITVNSGQIEFFGNKYSINRGEISFNNPAKIEPIINMDLSTQVRGITVDITFSGSLNKLNFSYRSDPPLEASDIIALLAVGRTPATAGPLGSSAGRD